MATFAAMAGVKLPERDREGKPIIFDSYDLTPVLMGKGPSPRKEWFYFTENELSPSAARVGNFKVCIERFPDIHGKIPKWPRSWQSVTRGTAARLLGFNRSMQHTRNCVSRRSVANEAKTEDLLHGKSESHHVGSLAERRISPADRPVV